MENTEKLEKLLAKENISVDEWSPEKIRKVTRKVEKKIEKVSKQQWIYAKRLLKFGTGACVFGFSLFVATLIILEGPALIWNSPPLSLSILATSPAIAVIMATIFLKKLKKREKRLEKIKEELNNAYSRAALKKLGEKI